MTDRLRLPYGGYSENIEHWANECGSVADAFVDFLNERRPLGVDWTWRCDGMSVGSITVSMVVSDGATYMPAGPMVNVPWAMIAAIIDDRRMLDALGGM